MNEETLPDFPCPCCRHPGSHWVEEHDRAEVIAECRNPQCDEPFFSAPAELVKAVPA